MKDIYLKLTYAALFVLAIGTFTSVSVSAISHILLIIPGLYFFYQDFITKEKPINLKGSSFFLLLMVVSIILSVVFNWDSIERPFKSISKIKYFVIPWLGVFALQRLWDSDFSTKSRKVLLHTFLVATSVATISGLIALKTGFNPLKYKPACHETRACGLYGMYMTYGYGISLYSVLLLSLFFAKQSFVSKVTLIPHFILGFAGTIFSYARGGWIGFLVGAAGFFMKKNLKAAILIVVLGVSSVIIAFYSSASVRHMITQRAASNAQRMAFFETAIIAFKEKPVFGWGYRNFEPNVKKIKKENNIAFPYFGGHAHNNLLEHLASTGAVGFIATLCFFLAWLRESFLRKDVIGYLVFPFALSFLASGMFQYTFGDGENLFLIMTVWMFSRLKI